MINQCLLLSLILIICFSWSIYAVPYQPSYLSSECNIGCNVTQCCTLGYQRFSVPQCTPLGLEGDNCYSEENNQPQDVFVSFPNGLGFYVSDVYRFFCPCSSEHNLKCVQNTCVLDNEIYK